MTQESLTLVTGLAHYLKILIRIALKRALKLDQTTVREAIPSFLDKLHLLAMQSGDPDARRLIENGKSAEPMGTHGVTYGYRSLAPEFAGESPFSITSPSRLSADNSPSDLCIKCNQTVEEDCVRLGTFQRWHSHCLKCNICDKTADVPNPKKPTLSEIPDEEDDQEKDEAETEKSLSKPSIIRRPPANVDAFVYDLDSVEDIPHFGKVPSTILCTDHSYSVCRSGFQPVTRLEQYAYLLNVALRRLYLVLQQQGVIPLSPGTISFLPAHLLFLGIYFSDASTAFDVIPDEKDPYRNVRDIVQMAPVHLDRELSAVNRLPKRSTIVENLPGGTVPPTSPHEIAKSFQLQHDPSPTLIPDPEVTQPREVNFSPTLSSHVPDDRIPPSDIPQFVEEARRREEQHSLPRQSTAPYISELNALELAIVRHLALLTLLQSPIKDHVDFNGILELIEMKKGGFWNKLFKPGDKRNVKKKGESVFGTNVFITPI